MATITLYPTADTSLNHSCSSGSSGFAMIDETSSDSDSTYIYQSVTSKTSTTVTSQFKISGTSVGKIKISGVTLGVYYKKSGSSTNTATLICSLICGGSTYASSSVSMSTSYSLHTMTKSASDLGIADKVYDSFDAANFGVKIQTTAKKWSSWGSTYQARISQVYLTVTYEIVNEGTGIYLKQNGAYKQAQNAYKKVSGVWVKQDASTLKTEMQSGKYILG